MTLLTSNPLYHATIALAALAVYAAGRTSRAFDVFLVIGLFFALLSVPLNLATGSTGPTELFALPSATMPEWLGNVRLGGAVTGESLLYAVDSALALMAVICLASAFNASVDHGQLLKLTPPAFAQLGVILTVSLVIIPETIASVAAISEARSIRGRRTTPRAIPGLLIAILGEALERSVQRAESLDARGFGALSEAPRGREWALGVLALLVFAVSAFAWFYYPDARWACVAALALAAAALVYVLWQQGRRGAATRLWRPVVRPGDWALLAAVAGSALAFIVLRAAGWGAITYLPFPAATVPPYHVAAAFCCLAMLAPAAFGLSARRAA